MRLQTQQKLNLRILSYVLQEASGWTILSIQALETAAAMIFIVASGRPHMLLSLASHVLVSMFAPAWLVLSAEANAKDLEQKLQGASTLSSRWVQLWGICQPDGTFLDPSICGIRQDDCMLHPRRYMSPSVCILMCGYNFKMVDSESRSLTVCCRK